MVQERVFTPCLENVPEYFEHTARVMLKGLGTVSKQLETGALLFSARNLANVPGYVYTEDERITLQKKLKEHLKGKSEDIGMYYLVRLNLRPAWRSGPNTGLKHVFRDRFPARLI